MVRETLRFLVWAIVFCLAIAGVSVLLTGCSELKYVDCIARDNTSLPCQ